MAGIAQQHATPAVIQHELVRPFGSDSPGICILVQHLFVCEPSTIFSASFPSLQEAVDDNRNPGAPAAILPTALRLQHVRPGDPCGCCRELCCRAAEVRAAGVPAEIRVLSSRGPPQDVPPNISRQDV